MVANVEEFACVAELLPYDNLVDLAIIFASELDGLDLLSDTDQRRVAELMREAFGQDIKAA